MSYTQTSEEARIIINLDFSIVVPGRTFYEFNEEDLPAEPDELPEGAALVLDLCRPKPIRVGADLSDPIARGVIKNYAAGIFINRYGTDVKQASAFETKKAQAIYGLKTSRMGTGYFVVVTERGLYEGRAIIPGMPNKQRLQLLQQILASLTRYGSTPSEITAVKEKEEQDKRDQARAEQLEAEAAARREARAVKQKEEAAAQSSASVSKETSAQRSAESTAQEAGTEQNAEKKASAETADAAKEAASAQGTEAAGGTSAQQEIRGNGPRNENTDAAASENSAGSIEGNGAEKSAAEHAKAERPASEAADQETQDRKGSEEQPGAKAAGQEAEDRKETEEQLTPEEQHIRELEQKRKEHLDELRKRFAGNPQVESGIDNYIARVDHTGDEIVRTFSKFLGNVQEYAASAQFTSEEDPAYLEMIKGIREEELGLGRKLDDLTRSVNTNVADAVEAGISEPFVERMIRMVERLSGRYDHLAVSMNGQDRIAYTQPTEIEEIITKWKNFRENLPSQLEETDKKREMETSNRIQARIKEERAHLLQQQKVVEEAEADLQASEETLRQAQKTSADFEAEYEKRKLAITEEKQDRLNANKDAAAAVETKLTDTRAEVEELAGELAKTFALNVNKKKTLSARIEDLNQTISEDEAKQKQLHDAAESFEADEQNKLEKLEDERQQVSTALNDAQQRHDAMDQALQDAQKDLEQSRKNLSASEEEWKHVHENYLLGKYD